MTLLRDATDQELEAYAAGKLKRVTNRKGVTRLVPVLHKHPNDKDVTSQEKRAYWRVWYMKNLERRRAYSRAYNARKKGAVRLRQPGDSNSRPVLTSEEAKRERERNYMRQWRKKNKKYCQAYAHNKYLKDHPKKKLNWFQRMIAWTLNA